MWRVPMKLPRLSRCAAARSEPSLSWQKTRWPALLALLLFMAPLASAQILGEEARWLPTARLVQPHETPVMAAFCPLETPACGRIRADFGHDVALDGTTAVVGSPYEGTVHMFERGPTGWDAVASFTGPRGHGTQVAVSSGVAAASDPSGHTIQLYERNGSEWANGRTLSVAGSECFGRSLALDEDHLVVSDPCRSLVHVFARASDWSRMETLMIHGVETLGFSVSISGSLVGASSSAGTFVFDLASGGPGPSLVTTASGGFVSLDGDALALFAGDGVEIHERAPTGWVKTATLSAGDASPFQEISYFGWDLALRGDTLVVGAAEDDPSPGSIQVPESSESLCVSESGVTTCLPPRPGAAYVFTNGPKGWQQSDKLVGDVAGDHRFGAAVALDPSETTILVGAPHKWVASLGGVIDVDPADTVYVFERGGV